LPVSRWVSEVFPNELRWIEILGTSAQPSWSSPLLQSYGFAVPARFRELDSLGIRLGAPLLISPQPSTPGTQAHPRTASANCQSRSVLVVSHHLDGLLQLRLCGSIAPRNQLEVRRFSGPPACLRRNGDSGFQGAFPGDVFHTLQSFPLISSRTASPPAPGTEIPRTDVHQRPLPP